MCILSAGNPDFVLDIEEYLKDLEKEVLGDVENLEKVGWESYSASRSEVVWRSRVLTNGEIGPGVEHRIPHSDPCMSVFYNHLPTYTLVSQRNS